ncbi:putative exonuclease V [Coleophoma crateriformis]|uniref:Putative exonuclease V n=1 Tax=Coleophoma crateriformis TaxID=565419 RepID=A0A3D8T1M4_9HELO|nr:putative exonuclease V [Coleophoma crateriformis]
MLEVSFPSLRAAGAWRKTSIALCSKSTGRKGGEEEDSPGNCAKGNAKAISPGLELVRFRPSFGASRAFATRSSPSRPQNTLPLHGLTRCICGMASPANTVSIAQDESATEPEDISDYGSDFSPEEQEIVERLITRQQVEAIEDNPIVTEVEHYDAPRSLHLPRILGREQQSLLYRAVMDAEIVAGDIDMSIQAGNHANSGNKLREATPVPGALSPPSELPDTRSPLERYRTHPRKALSVTDLVSPAWCELQYAYTLAIHGRKKQTVAMRQGSVVHKKLEDEVHTTVQIDVATKEDAWGLRIWNVIQGLQTLRETGQTRELEIWGTIDGLVVNGVIDDVSYICPDTDLEESLQRPTDNEPLPLLDQPTLEEFFSKKGGSSTNNATRTQRATKSKKIYLCDVKTRGARTLPSEAAFRPTKMQLMLYHHLFLALATGTVDFSIIIARYGLEADAALSDSFIAQVGSLNEGAMFGVMTGSDDGTNYVSSQDSMDILLAHNSLNELWSLMISEFRKTLPHGAASLGKVLKAEYRSRDTGGIMGCKTFAMDGNVLGAYIEREMRWWNGQREPEGVAVEEAYKCRTCEFAENCEWRLGKVDAAIQRARDVRTKKSTK